jgi:Zn-dependent protease
VLLAEPPPSQGDFHFSLLGFPVRIHPFFWLMTIMLVLGQKDIPPVYFITWVVAVVLCILLHELGHALVMRAYGYEASIVLYSFGGLAIPRGRRYGFREPGPWGQILISLAGPASGFILAAVLALGLRYLGGYDVHFLDNSWRDVEPWVILPNETLHYFVGHIFHISVWWGLLNLLPVYPLDGGQIAFQVFTLVHPPDAMRHSLILSVIVGGLVCFAAFVQLHDWFLGVLFLWLTYSNFSALQSMRVW